MHQSESFGERLTDTKNYSRGSVRSNANPDKGRNDSQVHRSNVLEAQRRVEGSRRQLFEQNQNDKREIDQLFRDNLVNAFKQAAGIKKIEAYQDINAHGRNR